MAKLKVGQVVTFKNSSVEFLVKGVSEDFSVAEVLRVETDSEGWAAINVWDEIPTALLVVVKTPKAEVEAPVVDSAPVVQEAA